MATIINGRDLANEIDEQTKIEVEKLSHNGVIPHLVVILVGEDEASQIYVRNKHKRAESMGIKSTIIRMPENSSEDELLTKIADLNKDKNVHAILVQLPLPEQINEQRIIEAIFPSKDADGFSPVNVGKLSSGETYHLPVACTPMGIMEMFKKYAIDLDGKNAVVVGRSNIVGKPMANLLLNENATVTIAHSHTKNITNIIKQADILVVATGIAHFIKKDQVKAGATVIDVGMDRDENGKLTGDVDFEEVKSIASFITPVPKGVGPMTISMLMKQTVNLAKWSI